MLLGTKIIKYLDEVRGAIHVGAHEGQERHFYRKCGFKRVLWFEPIKQTFEILQRNIQGFKGHVVFNVGVHDTLKEAIIHVSSNNAESSSILEFGLHAQYRPQIKYVRDEQIQLVRLDTFLQEKGYDIRDFNFLNVDVQGVEFNVLKSLGKLIERLDYVYLEVNEAEVYKGCALLPEIDAYLKSYGFYQLQIIMNKAQWGDAFYKRYG